jgi:hypothetical protein
LRFLKKPSAFFEKPVSSLLSVHNAHISLSENNGTYFLDITPNQNYFGTYRELFNKPFQVSKSLETSNHTPSFLTLLNYLEEFQHYPPEFLTFSFLAVGWVGDLENVDLTPDQPYIRIISKPVLQLGLPTPSELFTFSKPENGDVKNFQNIIGFNTSLFFSFNNVDYQKYVVEEL